MHKLRYKTIILLMLFLSVLSICLSSANAQIDSTIRVYLRRLGIKDSMNIELSGNYYITDEMLAYLRENFPAGWTDDKGARNRIKTLFDEYSYLCDTHTAVAVEVYEKYRERTGDTTKTIIASTASPYKFPRAVLKAISGRNFRNDFNAAKEIEKLSGLPMPKQLRELSKKEPRFTKVCEKKEMADFVLSTVGGEN